MKLYQCCVRGPMKYFRSLRNFYSTKIFTTKGGAEKFMPEFKEMCLRPLDEGDMFFLESIQKEKVLELELDS